MDPKVSVSPTSPFWILSAPERGHSVLPPHFYNRFEVNLDTDVGFIFCHLATWPPRNCMHRKDTETDVNDWPLESPRYLSLPLAVKTNTLHQGQPTEDKGK